VGRDRRSVYSYSKIHRLGELFRCFLAYSNVDTGRIEIDRRRVNR
jgi:hypothetical protein